MEVLLHKNRVLVNVLTSFCKDEFEKCEGITDILMALEMIIENDYKVKNIFESLYKNVLES